MTRQLHFSCALITGASSGLGAEYARQLAPRCARMILLARREEPMRFLAEEIRAAHPHLDVFIRATDLADGNDHADLMTWLSDDQYAPDLLVNNAGLGDYGEFATAGWDRIEAILRVNIEALTRLTHSLLPNMIRRGSGAILNVSSLASTLPIPDFAVYAASKAYVTSLSEALRIELAAHHIRVVAVCPGPVHTGFGTTARRSGSAGDGMPGKEFFYTPAPQVVAESLAALDRNEARIYPGITIALAAAAISLIPMFALRAILSTRPRRA